MKLGELEVYKISREISGEVWQVYKKFDWQMQKIVGEQWVRSVDSISANIVEGWGRFHYLDKNKFNYNARGSLYESLDWTDKFRERDKINQEEFISIINKLKLCLKKLNSYIKSTKSQANKKDKIK